VEIRGRSFSAAMNSGGGSPVWLRSSGCRIRTRHMSQQPRPGDRDVMDTAERATTNRVRRLHRAVGCAVDLSSITLSVVREIIPGHTDARWIWVKSALSSPPVRPLAYRDSTGRPGVLDDLRYAIFPGPMAFRQVTTGATRASE
jgi:hypothetical protein